VDIKNQITKALERTAEVDAKKIHVEIRGTTVILSGAVKSWVEREAAERAAWAAPGVANIENMIEVGA
jgi:osmotically-inducible protein OsmY